MANNRMFLVCPCGERFHLAKCYADGWYTWGEPGMYVAKLDTWFEAHRNCEPRVWGGTIMSLGYEQTEELLGMTRRPALTGLELFIRKELP